MYICIYKYYNNIIHNYLIKILKNPSYTVWIFVNKNYATQNIYKKNYTRTYIKYINYKYYVLQNTVLAQDVLKCFCILMVFNQIYIIT